MVAIFGMDVAIPLFAVSIVAVILVVFPGVGGGAEDMVIWEEGNGVLLMTVGYDTTMVNYTPQVEE